MERFFFSARATIESGYDDSFPCEAQTRQCFAKRGRAVFCEHGACPTSPYLQEIRDAEAMETIAKESRSSKGSGFLSMERSCGKDRVWKLQRPRPHRVSYDSRRILTTLLVRVRSGWRRERFRWKHGAERYSVAREVHSTALVLGIRCLRRRRRLRRRH
jgi:hypothetical protein